jgi:hypothetical protein
VVAVPLGQSQVQQKSGSSQKAPQPKDTGNLNGKVDELTKSVQNLEATTAELHAKLATLEQKQSKIVSLNNWRTDQLNQVKSDLERFDCQSDQDRARILAVGDRLPGYAYEGAGAMNCTLRLKNIIEKAVQVLNQE